MTASNYDTGKEKDPPSVVKDLYPELQKLPCGSGITDDKNQDKGGIILVRCRSGFP
ncbi:MAG: hypothetical protein ACUBOA_12200 [Candidatus Loosdrechtia sp.]|uniref:hypothetical protein n=1 Tax=Candidatus Loosdrechtia sp. TaxID=3101272 RepID=UPI003A76810E|nr:MAG: hypothetical protein QY305_14570 [Candidatus Jettenia sp. AMX2]